MINICKDKCMQGVVGGQYQVFTSILFIKSKLQCERLAPFCNSKILFHKISVRSNTIFYALWSFPKVNISFVPLAIKLISKCRKPNTGEAEVRVNNVLIYISNIYLKDPPSLFSHSDLITPITMWTVWTFQIKQ